MTRYPHHHALYVAAYWLCLISGAPPETRRSLPTDATSPLVLESVSVRDGDDDDDDTWDEKRRCLVDLNDRVNMRVIIPGMVSMFSGSE